MEVASPTQPMGITIIHYAFPSVCFLYYALALAITVCTLQTQSLRIKDQHVRRGVMIALILVVSGSYLAEAINALIQCAVDSTFDIGQDRLVYLIASAGTFAVQALNLSDTKFPVWYPYYVPWFLGILVELVLIVVPNVLHQPKNTFDFACIIIQALRITAFITLPSLYFGLRNDKKEYDNADAERQALLSKKLSAKASSSEESGNGYGTIEDEDSDTADNTSEAGSEDSWILEQQKTKDLIAKRLKQDGNWFTYAKGFTIFFPYIWPFHSKTLQLRAVLVGVCLLASNAMNVLVPRQMGRMVDSLDRYVKHQPDSTDPVPNIWLPVLQYALLLFISGGACIGWLRKWLWLPVEQYSYDALSTASHAHLMGLSSDFHDNKTSSELAQSVAGGRSVSELLETVCFQVIPMFIDLTIAFGYLSGLFGPLMGLTLVAEATVYLYVTTKLVAQRAEKRRDYVTIYRKEWTVGQQSLDGWNTASLFNQIPYEQNRYSSAVKDHMKAKKTYELSSQTINAAQGAIMTVGLVSALFLGVWQVSRESKSIGNLTTLLVYWAQLQNPLIFFSNMYRNISYSLMDSERLLELFQTKPTIADTPDAKPLKLTSGVVKFHDVSFAYDERKPTLKEVSFSIPAGKSVALVGETGGGKTTILKLIDRFYDVKCGSITIDGQDIRDVTLESLRAKIGVVPQDPMLFNDSIMNNIRYARLNASDDEVYEACKAAAVHEKIVSFPDGYNSKVGDRGVKLSGGEKQRVAIARAILKRPELILLDEATSAVDTETEVQIQEGFRSLCHGRTTFIVAHRLSTVMRADLILVVMNGEIVEQGSHSTLLCKNGKYASLWSKQISVKPNDTRSRSKSPRKRDGDLINDLTTTQQATSLVKVERTSEQHQDEDDDVEAQSAIEDDKFYGGGGHKREVSTLKPEAPEFVPKSVKAVSVRSATTTKIDTGAKKQPEMSQLKPSDRSNLDGAGDITRDESQRTQPTNHASLATGGTSTLSEPKFRHIRSQRRQGSKSESSAESQDSDFTAVSSGEGSSVTQPRRVSAPIVANRGRVKRNRKFRLRTRNGDHLDSRVSSSSPATDGSTDESEARSNEVPTPASVSGQVDSTALSVTKPTIRFDPHC